MKGKGSYGQPVPPNPRYDFDAFIQRVKNLDFEEMAMKTDGACGSAENSSWDRPGAVAARESGSVHFANRLKELLFFLNHKALPTQGLYDDRAVYKEIAESLVAKGQWKKEALDLFKPVS